MRSLNLEWCIKPLNFDQSSLPVETVFSLLFEEFNPSLPEEPVMAFPEVIALQDIADCPQELRVPLTHPCS